MGRVAGTCNSDKLRRHVCANNFEQSMCPDVPHEFCGNFVVRTCVGEINCVTKLELHWGIALPLPTQNKKRETSKSAGHFAMALQGRPTKADVKKKERKERQDELGVCRIRRCEGDHKSQTLGSGFVVKDLQINTVFSCPYCLITSDKVFPKDDWSDSTIKKYHLDFRKLKPKKLKTVKLEDVADRSKTGVYQTSGLVVIPIKPSKECGETDSVFTYRPFKVAKEGTKPDDDLNCHYVDENAESFAVKWLELKQLSVQYELQEAHENYKTYDDLRTGYRKPYGAAILKRSNSEFMAAGALTFTDDEWRNISPVFFPLPLGEYRRHLLCVKLLQGSVQFVPQGLPPSDRSPL